MRRSDSDHYCIVCESAGIRNQVVDRCFWLVLPSGYLYFALSMYTWNFCFVGNFYFAGGLLFRTLLNWSHPQDMLRDQVNLQATSVASLKVRELCVARNLSGGT